MKAYLTKLETEVTKRNNEAMANYVEKNRYTYRKLRDMLVEMESELNDANAEGAMEYGTYSWLIDKVQEARELVQNVNPTWAEEEEDERLSH